MAISSRTVFLLDDRAPAGDAPEALIRSAGWALTLELRIGRKPTDLTLEQATGAQQPYLAESNHSSFRTQVMA